MTIEQGVEKKLEKQIETIPEAAKEITRIYGLLKPTTIELTGENWRAFVDRKLPKNKAVSDKETIKLGVYFDHMNFADAIGHSFCFEKKGDVLELERRGVGNDAGSKWKIYENGHMEKAGYRRTEPFSGPQGSFPARIYLDEKSYKQIETVDEELKKVINGLEKYAPNRA